MTKREKEILEIIRGNPLISQKELAQRLGITRSSVGGHIMNLTDKGQIKGKGYILPEKAYAVVIGGANMDIQGFPEGPLVSRDSNPGKVALSCGGVGRNIAENMARLGLDVKLLTLIGGDSRGKELLEQTEAVGVDMNHILRLPGEATSTYLSILDEKGDMALALAHMSIMERFDPAYIRSEERLLRNAALIVLDANLPEGTIAYICSRYGEIPILADAVSTAKAPRLRESLPRIKRLKPNRLEAEVLTGRTIRNDRELEEAAQLLLQTGLNSLVVSLGEEGVYYRDAEKALRLGNPSRLPGKPINATGAGDAFTAGMAYGMLEGLSEERTLRFALGASAMTLCHEDTINPNLSVDNIENHIRENAEHE